MSRVAVALVALACAAGAVRAQERGGGVAAARARLARADSLLTQLQRRDSMANRQVYFQRRARLFAAGQLVALLPGTVGTETGQRLVAGARDDLDGAVPPTFVDAYVVAAAAATDVDSALRADGLSSRRIVEADVDPRPDSLADGWVVAGAIAAAYRQALDTTWRSWLPLVLPAYWTIARNGRNAVRELMGAETRTGADCLGGSVRGCRLWLGLDADADLYRSRYRPEELRRMIENRWFGPGAERDLYRQCMGGSDEACQRAAPLTVPAVPAGFESRASLLDFVRTRKPAGGLVRALADSAGPIGERLAHASGMQEDTLVADWRTWLLTGGGLPTVTASLRDALPVAFFVGLLLFAASRSGRWR